MKTVYYNLHRIRIYGEEVDLRDIWEAAGGQTIRGCGHTHIRPSDWWRSQPDVREKLQRLFPGKEIASLFKTGGRTRAPCEFGRLYAGDLDRRGQFGEWAKLNIIPERDIEATPGSGSTVENGKIPDDNGRSPDRRTVELILKFLCHSSLEEKLGTELFMQCPFDYRVIPQHLFFAGRVDGKELGWIRIDFAILRSATTPTFVECDGPGFHDQPESDRLRDKAASAKGIVTLRYNAQQICENVSRCATEIWRTVKSVKSET